MLSSVLRQVGSTRGMRASTASVTFDMGRLDRMFEVQATADQENARPPAAPIGGNCMKPASASSKSVLKSAGCTNIVTVTTKSGKEVIRRVRRKKQFGMCFEYYTEDDDYDYEDLDLTLTIDPAVTCCLDDLLYVLQNQCHLMHESTLTTSLPKVAAILESFVNTHHYLFTADGPLPLSDRHYIALLAAERFKCGSLVAIHRTEFLANRGDPTWLRTHDGGIPWHVPRRIINIQELNKFLAHRPWLLTSRRINKLRTTPRAMWSLSQLAQAIAVITHTHALAVFMAGCQLFSADVTVELCKMASHQPDDAPSPSPDQRMAIRPLEWMQPLFCNGRLTCVVRRKKMIALLSQRFGNVEPGVCYECVKGFVETEESTFRELRSWYNGAEQPPQEESPIADFASTWNDTCCPLFNHLCPDVGEYLDVELRSINQLLRSVRIKAPSMSFTDTRLPFNLGSWGDIDERAPVTREEFMYAVWYYVHYVFGILYDECNYARVMRILTDRTRAYIKLVVCFPNRVYEKEFVQVLYYLPYGDLVQLNILLMAARLNAELVYAMRAVTINMNA